MHGFLETVAFYYYDFDLRNILNRYLSRIEVDIRTTIINELFNKYKNNSFWYVDPKIVGNHFITKFTSEYYPKIRENDPIKRHHKKYSDQYAPAWKTMEYMTLGNLEHLYSSLLFVKKQWNMNNRAKLLFLSLLTATILSCD